MNKVEELYSLIENENIKVISFDIFDTLLVRPMQLPLDIFRIVGYRHKIENFRYFRKIAESIARLNKDSSKTDDITLDEIYEELRKILDIDLELLNEVKKTELYIEKQYLKPRKFVKAIYEKALSLNKEIIIVSDMYLPYDFITELLCINGFKDYKKLYLSSVEKKAKGTGKLFELIRDEYKARGIETSQILHIGDNIIADIEKAQLYGLNTFYIPKAIEVLYENLNLRKLIEYNHIKLDSTFLIGFIANELFDNPFIKYDNNTFFDNKLKNISLIVLSPILIIFTKWLIENIIRNNHNKIYFTMRDGFIPIKIFNIMNKYYNLDIDINELHLNRAIRYQKASSTFKNFLNQYFDLGLEPDVTLEEFVENRMFLSEKEKNTCLSFFLKNGKNPKDLFGFLSENIEELKLCFELCKKDMAYKEKNIDKYIDMGFPTKDNIAIFDIGYRGSVGKFLKQQYNIKTHSYQLFSTPLVAINQKQIDINSFSHLSFEERKGTFIIELFEVIISSLESSLKEICFDNNEIKLLLEDNVYKKENILAIQEIQNNLLGFAEEFITMFGDDLKYLCFDGELFMDLIKDFMKDIPISEQNLFKDITFKDSAFICNKKIGELKLN
ncbi:hypothetical protein [Aliarcobacter butzleri]|uniref:hypothetical protein n=1 Tax=Aliarcobacter butzleri TaxID=28197 RepID=UPI0021B3A8E7|nr:hypothetical protein [Aliarcobacter butzleri]MCT7584808.1 hypothetical protein [Aliarcobacter butzleri]